MCRCESGWSPHFRWAEVDRLSSAKAKEGVASWATVRALRVRFPAGSASARSRHLSIEFFRRAVESGLSVKSRCVAMCRDERVQTPRHQATDGIPTRLLPVVVVGPNADGYRSSTGRTPGLDREAAGSNPAESKPVRISLPNALVSTGRRIGLSLITTRSLVRVQPSAPKAGVAQWRST